MKQFILPESPGDVHIDASTGEGEAKISGKDFHYLRNVRKVQEGASFPGRTKEGIPLILTVTSVHRDHLILRIQRPPQAAESAEQDQIPPITLYQSLPKGQKMDLIVRQATEAGAAALVPVVSDYSIPRLTARDCIKKVERWERIAREASQQCGSSRILRVFPLIHIDEIPVCEGNTLGLTFHHIPLENNTLHGYLSSRPSAVSICIGPEGGFSEREVALLSGR